MKVYRILLWFVIVCSSLLSWISGFAAPNENEVVASQGFTVLNTSVASALPSDPMDMHVEHCRRETFEQMPSSSLLNQDAAARHGLYFTMYNDIVKCFSCKRCSFAWQECSVDHMNSKKLHESNCRFLTAPQNAGNIAINGGISLQFIDYPNDGQSSALPSVTAQFSQHLRGEHVSQPITTHDPRQTEQHVMRSVSMEAVLRYDGATSPHMAQYAARLASYNIGNWDSRGLNQYGFRPPLSHMPEKMAEAGLFYIGPSDRVKCWHCNGGLHNWKTNDNPWVEHARWYPECNYVVENKGPEFIRNIVQQPRYKVNSRFPLANATQNRSPAMSEVREIVGPSYLPTVESGPNYLTPHYTPSQQSELMTDPTASLKIALAKAADFPKVDLIDMGYDSNLVEACLYDFYQRNPADNTQVTIQELVNALCNQSESDQTNLKVAFTAAKARLLLNTVAQDPSSGYLDDPSLPMAERVRRAEEARMCQKCKRAGDDYKSCIVFTPCGHLAACRECGMDESKTPSCPVCAGTIKQRLRCYMAYQKQRKGFIRPHLVVALTR